MQLSFVFKVRWTPCRGHIIKHDYHPFISMFIFESLTPNSATYCSHWNISEQLSPTCGARIVFNFLTSFYNAWKFVWNFEWKVELLRKVEAEINSFEKFNFPPSRPSVQYKQFSILINNETKLSVKGEVNALAFSATQLQTNYHLLLLSIGKFAARIMFPLRCFFFGLVETLNFTEKSFWE